MISDVKEKTLMPIIRCKIKPDSIIYSDHFTSYNALDVSEFKHHRIIQRNSRKKKITSTASKIFGVKTSDIYENSTAYRNTNSTCSSKDVNFVSIMARRNSY